ncbi:MAG: MCP four helix bundle domain-containing protein [Nitrosomonas sp.]|uniref:methyl-accepting chemotaxis protein n=1 Tax=Nitrosomonas sp. TaxID=42353 RepID=UPI001D9979FF|nr:methyl-accepting chemotaxis protein [Nitrosomonas sp.]MBX9895835.1 MCP four helix bundle domain-containing protein [Nitrosomonas sp.]
MFTETSIKFRLMLVMSILSVLMVSIGAYGLYGFNQSNHTVQSVYEDRMMPAVQLGTILDVWYQVREKGRIATQVNNSATAGALAEEANRLVKQNESVWAKYLGTSLLPEEETLTKIKGEQHVQYVQSMNKTFQLAIAGEFEAAAKNLETDTTPKFNALRDTVFALLDLQGTLASHQYSDSQSSFETISMISIAAIAASILLAITFGFLLLRSIVAPLDEAIEIAHKVAAGDLTSNIVVTSTKSSTGRLLQALKEMNDNLIDLVGKVRSGTDQIVTASGEIASGNSDLSQRTEEQASSLEETASSMEELTSTVRQNADNARQANQLAAGASEVAVKGGEVVGQVVHTMKSINESSHKIVDIISVIDGIAFQTNILALNAAVEAARAGEQGRGFAVVATEVRTLAQRSAAAAKEIKELISDSVSKVDEAGTTMEEIVTAVKRVTDIMSEISAASQEQSSGIEQVNQAVTQMDEVTQQNAALVEEAAAAAESMQEQAQALTHAVSTFKLANSHAATIAPVKRSNHATNIAKLPNRGPATKKAPAAIALAAAPAKPRKAATGTGEDWEEF